MFTTRKATTGRAPRCHDLGRKRRRLGEIVSHSSLSRVSLAARSFPHQRRGITFSFRFYLASTATAPLRLPSAWRDLLLLFQLVSYVRLRRPFLDSFSRPDPLFLLITRDVSHRPLPRSSPFLLLSLSLLLLAIMILPPIIRRLAKRVSFESPSFRR